MEDVFSVAGKRTIVTGGALGIGYGIAKRFVNGGARVLVADVDAEATGVAVRRLGGAPNAAGIVIDIASDDAPARIVTAAMSELGGVDVLVNNAGIFPNQPILEMPAELFDRVMRINVRGLVLLSRAVARAMIQQQRGGRIVNIGSIDSVHPSMVGLAAYDASKGAVRMFNKSLALELAPHGIHVNAILPGGVTTEDTSKGFEGSGMTDAQMKEIIDRFVAQKVPMRRMGVPDDIARIAQVLASSASDYMTGSEVVVDGGALLT